MLVELLAGRLYDEDLAGLSDLTDLKVEALFFLSAGALKPGDLTVPWPSTTPTTVTCAGSTRVGLTVTEDEGSLLGVVVFLESRFSFLIL